MAEDAKDEEEYLNTRIREKSLPVRRKERLANIVLEGKRKPSLLPLLVVSSWLISLGGSCAEPVSLPKEVSFPNSSRVAIGYYPAWKRSEFDHTRVRCEFLTHIAHAFTKPDPQGNLIVPEYYLYPELLDEAHDRGVKVLVSVGGWGNCEGFPGMTSTPQTRSRFINQVIGFVTRHGYDGVDIDWEFVSTAEEQTNFVQLVKELSVALKAQNPPLLLTMAAPSGHYWGKWVSYEEVVADFDYISAMTYDYHGPWSDHSGHNSPLYSCGGDVCGSFHDSALYLLSRGVPPEKLLLGLAFFGRSFDCGGLYRKFEKSSYYGYAEVVDLLRGGWRAFWDDCAKVPWLQSPDWRTILSYDDEKSIFLKCQYVLASRIAGVIIWEITHDDERDGPVLLGVVQRAFERTEERASAREKLEEKKARAKRADKRASAKMGEVKN